jgi:hypothetical protein
LLFCQDQQLRNKRGVHADWWLSHSRHQYRH